MSSGRRVAKRSILGTRIVAPGDDGRYYPGMIQAVKTDEDFGNCRSGDRKYSVRFEGTRKVSEFSESEIIGPGFQTVSTIKLRPGQLVYITYCNREVQGTVVCHRPTVDQVIIRILNGGPEVKKKLEEVRLLESRKSARILSQGNTDFSKLADFNIVHERKRINSETSDISGTSGRKRRGSESAMSDSSSDHEYSTHFQESRQIMSECTAAMVLMNLSCSPTAVKLRAAKAAAAAAAATREAHHEHPVQAENPADRLTPSSPGAFGAGGHFIVDGSVSPSSSGISSLGSSWSTIESAVSHDNLPNDISSNVSPEAEALLQLSNHHESDEGIVSDQSMDNEDATKRNKTEHVRIVYQCTWRGCSVQMDSCSHMETHVRRLHLGRQEPVTEEDVDGEEEFYYTEIEVPVHAQTNNNNLILRPSNPVTKFPLSMSPSMMQSSSPNTTGVSYLIPARHDKVSSVLVADHMDMARPPHENPEYFLKSTFIGQQPNLSESFPVASFSAQTVTSLRGAMPIAIPVNKFTFSTPAQVLPTPPRAPTAQQTGGGKYIRLGVKPSVGTSIPAKSPHRKPRGDAKKCRKVYGMDHRDQWCTQCKWKKACTRFGENS